MNSICRIITHTRKLSYLMTYMFHFLFILYFIVLWTAYKMEKEAMVEESLLSQKMSGRCFAFHYALIPLKKESVGSGRGQGQAVLPFLSDSILRLFYFYPTLSC